MYKYLSPLLFLAFLVTGFVSCSKNDETILLEKANSLVSSNPDSALILLDSIGLPERDLSENDYMNYLVTRIQARYKLFLNIGSDTAIFGAVRYFEEKGDAQNTAVAALYAGCVNRDGDKNAKSIRNFLHALRFATQTPDNDLKGLIEYNIGRAYYTENMHDSTVNHFKKAVHYYNYNPQKNDTTILNIYNAIGNSYLIAENVDSSNVYYNKSLAMADKLQSNYYKTTILQNIGIMYQVLEDYTQSNTYLSQALPFGTNEKDSVSIYINLVSNYCLINQLDSANYYNAITVDLLRNVNDVYVHYTADKMMMDYYAMQNDFEKAFYYSQQRNDNLQEIQQKEQSVAILDMERNYNMSQKEKALIKMQMREQYFILIITLAVLFLLLAGVAIALIRNKIRCEKVKNELLNKKMRNTLYLNKLLHQMTLALSAYEKEIDILSNNFGVKEKSKGYALIQDEQKKLHKVIKDTLSAMAIDFLQTQNTDPKIMAHLSQTELAVIFLAECSYEFKDIATMLSVSQQALSMRKKRLEEKLESEGFSASQIQQLFRKVIEKGEIT